MHASILRKSQIMAEENTVKNPSHFFEKPGWPTGGAAKTYRDDEINTEPLA